MKKVCFGFLMLLGAFILPTGAFAQSNSTTRAEIPFAFYAGRAQMPAGTYTIRVSDDDRNLLLRNVDGSAATFLLAQPGESSEAMQPSLRFDHIGDSYFLRAATDLDQEYDFAEPKAEKTMERNGELAQSTVITNGL